MNHLIYAQRKLCRHREAFEELGFINWKMKGNFRFNVGDHVFVYMKDDFGGENSVRFETVVEAENVKREDTKYWINPSEDRKDDMTYRLRAVKEYRGSLLNDTMLNKHNFHGPQSLQTPIKNNAELLGYIESVFRAEKDVRKF